MNPVAYLLRGTIRGYQWFLSPIIGPGCRFAPSCSEYAHEAVSRYGALRGSWLAAIRVLRCHPWGGSGYDPVPDSAESQRQTGRQTGRQAGRHA